MDGAKKYPPIPADLGRKLGVFRYREAVERFLTERLSEPSEAFEVAPEPPPVEAPPPLPTPTRPRRICRCSVCGQPGHRFETCPMRLASPATVRPAHQKRWKGYSPTGERGP